MPSVSEKPGYQQKNSYFIDILKLNKETTDRLQLADNQQSCFFHQHFYTRAFAHREEERNELNLSEFLIRQSDEKPLDESCSALFGLVEDNGRTFFTDYR